MRIFIVNPYGELPTGSWKEYRSYMLAKSLVESGHDVHWFLSCFDHRKKEFREIEDINFFDGKLITSTIETTSYSKNISFSRIFYEYNFGKNCLKKIMLIDKPDLIVIGYPAIFFGPPIIKFAKDNSIPYILDVIDIWPELFTVYLPRFLKRFSKTIFSPLYYIRSKQAQYASGIVAVSHDYLKVVQNDIQSNIPSEIIYWGVDTKISYRPNENFNSRILPNLIDFRRRFDLICIYAGTLGDAYDMDLIINAIKIGKKRNLNVGFIVAGNGPRFKEFEFLDSDNFLFLGLVDSTNLESIYSYCDVGLITYLNDSTVAMPIKIFDYLNSGLCILNSLGRDAGYLIESNDLGINFIPSNLEDFISKIIYLSNEKSTLESYKLNSKHISKRFDLDEQYLKYVNFIESVVEVS